MSADPKSTAKSTEPDPKPAPAKAAREDKDTGRGIPDAPAGVGESTDPDVQKLLAEREIAVQNRRTLDVDPGTVQDADDQIAAIDQKLNELGFK